MANNNNTNPWEIIWMIISMILGLGSLTMVATVSEYGMGQEPFSISKTSSEGSQDSSIDATNNPQKSTHDASVIIPGTTLIGALASTHGSSEDSSAPDIIINTENKCRLNQIERSATRAYNKYDKKHISLLERGSAAIAKDAESAKILEEILKENSREDILFKLSVLEKILENSENKSA